MRALVFAAVLGAGGGGCVHAERTQAAQAVCAAPVQHYEWSSEPGPAPATKAEARPRLAETRTLGAADDNSYTDARVYVARPYYHSGAPPGPAPPPHVIYGYGATYRGGYGYGYGAPRMWDAPRSRPSGGTPAIGGNWTAPPSYGPSFPFAAGPANPWR